MVIFKKKQLYLPALLILSVVILLLVWISFSTYQNFNRDREQTLEFVYRQGVAIIHTLESGAKTGLMLPGWSRRSMTALIEETGRNKDIAYIYLYDENGRVLYHSLPSLEQKETSWKPVLSAQEPVKSRVRTLSDTSQIYDLAKYFTAISDDETAVDAALLSKTYPGRAQFSSTPMVIVLGMNLNAFEEARKADFHHAIIMGIIVIALGCGALFFLFVIQNYYMVDRTLERTRDYTREVEERARRSEKLAAVGKLAAGVAHEIRNPLSSIKGFAQFLSRSLVDKPKEKEYAEIMVREVERIDGVVSDLLTLSRPAMPEPVPTDLAALFDHALRLVEDDAKTRNIKIYREMPQQMDPVLIDPGQITQALLNLMINALQSIEKNGNLVVGSAVDSEKKKVFLWVEDDGPGLPEEMKDQIYDPFFTTRARGTGLGLAIVRTIVENHGGVIDFISPAPNKKRGVRFTLTLATTSAKAIKV